MALKSSFTSGPMLAFALLAGCAQVGQSGGGKSEERVTTQRVGPGMGSDGVVIDASKVESGYGHKVKGFNDWEGEITGQEIPNSGFAKLRIGMPLKQVTDMAGQPTDRGAYITGKAFIPFYFGSDRFRYELVYKNQGRLVFAGGSMADLTGAHLIWIIYCPTEPGYR